MGSIGGMASKTPKRSSKPAATATAKRPAAAATKPAKPAKPEAAAKPTLREAQKQFTRQRLLDAAAASFEEKGYARTTIDDIVSGAGATRATFYLHFGAKGDIVREFMETIWTDVTDVYDGLGAAVASADRAALREWFGSTFRYWETLRPFAHVREEAMMLDPELRKQSDSTFEIGVAAIVKAVRERYGYDEDEARARATLVLAQLEMVFRRWMLYGWESDEDLIIDIVTEMWMAAFAAPLGD
jgi:AcrR family transcriptional regulator